MSDIPTPRTDAAAFLIVGYPHETRPFDIVMKRVPVTGDFRGTVASDFARELEREVIELKAWKESALSVDPPLQEIARELGLPLGLSIHDRILPAIQRLKAKNDLLEADLKRENDRLERNEWLEKENGNLKLLFKKYADHTTNCPVHFNGSGDCTCGFSGCLSRV